MSEDSVLQMEFYAPEKLPRTHEAAELRLPGAQGVLTVLPGHTPLLSQLAPGVIVARDSREQEEYFAISGGFVEVRENRVLILATAYEHESDIDVGRAETALEEARNALKRRGEDINVGRAELAIARALARMQAARREGY